MDREDKKKVVDEFVQIFSAPGVYLLDFMGLNVAEATELRRTLREKNVSMRVVKNTLLKRALQKAEVSGAEVLNEYLKGPTSVVWSSEDSLAPARLLLSFIKKYDKGAMKAGLVDGMVVRKDEIEAISKLPGKQELYAQVATILNAPLVKLAQTVNALPLKFVRTVDAVREKREKEEG